MNKALTIVLVVIAAALIFYNITLINFDNPLEGKSIIALIGIVASLCAIMLLIIFTISKKIQDKLNKN